MPISHFSFCAFGTMSFFLRHRNVDTRTWKHKLCVFCKHCERGWRRRKTSREKREVEEKRNRRSLRIRRNVKANKELHTQSHVPRKARRLLVHSSCPTISTSFNVFSYFYSRFPYHLDFSLVVSIHLPLRLLTFSFLLLFLLFSFLTTRHHSGQLSPLVYRFLSFSFRVVPHGSGTRVWLFEYDDSTEMTNEWQPVPRRRRYESAGKSLDSKYLWKPDRKTLIARRSMIITFSTQ